MATKEIEPFCACPHCGRRAHVISTERCGCDSPSPCWSVKRVHCICCETRSTTITTKCETVDEIRDALLRVIGADHSGK